MRGGAAVPVGARPVDWRRPAPLARFRAGPGSPRPACAARQSDHHFSSDAARPEFAQAHHRPDHVGPSSTLSATPRPRPSPAGDTNRRPYAERAPLARERACPGACHGAPRAPPPASPGPKGAAHDRRLGRRRRPARSAGSPISAPSAAGRRRRSTPTAATSPPSSASWPGTPAARWGRPRWPPSPSPTSAPGWRPAAATASRPARWRASFRRCAASTTGSIAPMG